jgi:hypothetical protein
LFWESEENTLEEEMFKIFPEITEKVEQLEKLNSEEHYEQIQELTQYLLDND